MYRVIVCNRLGTPLFDLPEDDVFELSRKEEVNGEHSLTVTTTRTLEQGWRILTLDERGRWREHVVYGTDALHDAGERPFGTYYCVWSVQPDLMGTRVSAMPGVQTPCNAAVALDAALGGTSRWQRGTVTNTATGGASMYDTDGWSAIKTMVATWGGEIDVTVQVDEKTGTVTARKVDYYAKQGEQTVKRRFDFGADLKSVRRTVPDGPLYCRITPRGRGEDTGEGYGRKITIASVNGGLDYLENTAMTDIAKLPDGSGGWEYPTLEVENPEMETPAELKTWAQGVLEESTVPKVTYEVDVLQLAQEGVDLHGVSLGDAVHVVDRKFGDGIRVSARVAAMTVNLLYEDDVQLTLGHIGGGVAGMMAGFGAQLSMVADTVQAMNGGTFSTADYLTNLVARINAEINATGGYAYIVPGHGILTYDTAVADPLNPVEAGQVVEVKGGTIRIADTRTAQGEWDWKTVFVSGEIASELVTAARLVTGYIQSADGRSYWNLDSNRFRTSHMEAYDMEASGQLATESGKYRTNVGSGGISMYYRETTSDSWGLSGTLMSTMANSRYRGLDVHSAWYPETGTYRHRAVLNLRPDLAYMSIYWLLNGQDQNFPMLSLSAGSNASSVSDTSTAELKGYDIRLTNTRTVYSGTLQVSGKITATGTKSRLVDTEEYGRRLLYCYESPSPMFGDVGSGSIGEDGLCFVSIDGVFGDTVRTDLAYQVFLQQCGQGDLWVAEKHPTHFIVEGTPGLAFDWEIKARQAGYEHLRMEDQDIEEFGYYDSDLWTMPVEAANSDPITEIEMQYVEELGL